MLLESLYSGLVLLLSVYETALFQGFLKRTTLKYETNHPNIGDLVCKSTLKK